MGDAMRSEICIPCVPQPCSLQNPLQYISGFKAALSLRAMRSQFPGREVQYVQGLSFRILAHLAATREGLHYCFSLCE